LQFKNTSWLFIHIYIYKKIYLHLIQKPLAPGQARVIWSRVMYVFFISADPRYFQKSNDRQLWDQVFLENFLRPVELCHYSVKNIIGMIWTWTNHEGEVKVEPTNYHFGKMHLLIFMWPRECVIGSSYSIKTIYRLFSLKVMLSSGLAANL